MIKIRKILNSRGVRLFPVSVKFRLALFAATALAILCLSIMPNPPVPQTGFLSWDKVQHAFAYALLASVAGWAFLPLMSSPVRAWRFALIFVLVFGGLIELLQAWLPFKRCGDVNDIVANSLGGLLIYGFVRLMPAQVLNKFRKNV